MAIELKEKIIDLLKPKNHQTLQISLNQDINVPDIKPDIDRILKTNTNISILEEDPLEDKIKLRGEIKINILYVPLNNNKPLHNIDTIIPFNEMINVDGVTTKDNVKVNYGLEDLQINLTNSRKLNLKSILQFDLDIDEKQEIHITADIGASEAVEKKYTHLDYCQLKSSTKESYVIKDELALPSGKPNIVEILWHDVTIQNKDIRILDGKINLKGTLHLATLYIGEGSESNVEFVEHDLSFNGLIDQSICREDMIHNINLKIMEESIEIRPDIDEEERVLEIKVETEVDVKIYSEEEVTLLEDLYSLEKELEVKKEKITYQKLVCKNNSQHNIKDNISIGDNAPDILQIYYTNGDVCFDDIQFLEDKINVEGNVNCKVMYVAANDDTPINVFETPIPFEYEVDIKGLKQDSITHMTPNINYINCTMIGEKELEVKCAVNISTIVFEECNVDVISEVGSKPIDIKSFQMIPGIIGYVVKDNDKLWDIAKKYKTKVDRIKSVNNLETDKLNVGDKIVIVKELDI